MLNPTRWPEIARFFAPTWRAVTIYSVWFGFQALLSLILPGKKFTARPGPSGVALSYNLNGLCAFLVTGVAYYLACFQFKIFSPTIAADNLPALITVVQLFSFGLSVYLWVRGRLVKNNPNYSGQFFADFWAGLELNPRSFMNTFDWKYFCAGRPGLNGWVMLNIQITLAYLRDHPGQGLPVPLLLCTGLQLWYIVDCWLFEAALTNILDITFDRFGFMLVFGDLAWVPFTYTLACLKLAHCSTGLPAMSPLRVCLVAALHLCGYTLFRGFNWQKHLYKTSPEKYPSWKTMKTEKGRLLIGGFFGYARHLNYTGDLLMALSWGLCTGFDRILGYFYFIYFAALLIHRQYRDEIRCGAKYGADWVRYCKIVPYRMLPGLF
eukprot:GAFH01002053.1.p1 GENE.GAFH01002053.1~~GAFH01002053.1.p1  ORF type:complete len:431 (+),score=107.42 GAFH01002053.1:158-1294(+)